MSRLQTGKLLDFQAAAFQWVSGNASGVTPIISAWILVDSVESIDVTLTTAASTNVTWSAQTARRADGADAVALVSPPTWPTGVNQNASVNIAIPDDARYLQLTATPSAGSGAITATPTVVYGKPAIIPHVKRMGVLLYCPSTAILAGQAFLEYSANYNPGNRDLGIGTLPKNIIDPAIWFPATKPDDTAYAPSALVASTGQKIALRMGTLEFIAMRARFAPSAGFGRYTATYNCKA